VWRRKLPLQHGHTGVLLRGIVREAGSEKPPEPDFTAMKPSKLPQSGLRFGNKKPKLTNLDKILYPDGFTKRQVIDYYTRVAPLMLPHLVGRAATFARYPDGVKGKSFFQKRCPEHRPPWVNTVRIRGDSEDAIEYCEIGDLSTLVWVANLAALEIHVPLALAESPDTPTAMVFDLDPGESAGLPDCFEVAQRISAVLKEQNLESVVKFSGKKGVHLFVPLNTPRVTFEQTKMFAKALAQLLARDDPQRITAVMRKDERRRKVFIDWNQNDRSKTMVCAYSLRAESTPRISWPVDMSSVADEPPSAASISIPTQDPLQSLYLLRQNLPSIA
jgi:bifunctional non-homologous end joining protein LigD